MSGDKISGGTTREGNATSISRQSDRRETTRRSVLKASGSAGALLATGTAAAHGDESEATTDYCAEKSIRPTMVHYDEAGMAACESAHPTSQQLQEDVATALAENYPTVGSLIEDDFVPYFDFVSSDGGTEISHWLSPEYLGDDSVLDPQRPESILVDHEFWRPIGVMFIATADGEPVHPPPAIYEGETNGDGDGGHSDSHSKSTDGEEGEETADGDPCLPWHAHVGLPGRKAWWQYRKLYVDAWQSLKEGLPCKTPWMMHVWAFPHPDGVYAHGALPRGYRGGPPAEPAGFETDAVPGEDELDEWALADAYKDRFEHLF